jgi:catalase
MNKSKICVTAMFGALLTTSAGNAITPNGIINSFQETFDIHREPRKDGNCICATGEFTGTPLASALSRSALFRGGSVPVVARFSAIPGNRNAQNSRQMDLEFHLPGGSMQYMAMLNTPLFRTSDPVAFGEMLAAVKPDPDTGQLDLQRLHEFLAARPDAFAQSNFVTATDSPSSYASSAYFSVHTFRFIDAEGRARFVRWRFLPQGGETATSPPEARLTAQSALRERFIERLTRGPIRWDMIVYVGKPADTTDNPSIAWPEERVHLKAGTLTITRAIPESIADCAKANFDPLIVADGIAPADDPLLLFRSPAYASAFSEILARALTSVRAAHAVDP